MQTSRYVPDENEGRKGERQASNLEDDYHFAEEVIGERRRIIATAEEKALGVVDGVRMNTKGDRWILLVIWAIELLWIMFVVIAVLVELWGSCPIITGLPPTCRYCYSGSFLIWNTVNVVIWIYHLYLSVLLVSRGFVFRLTAPGLVYVENEAKGVPKDAIFAFLILSLLLFIWLIIGVFILMSSSSCSHGFHIFAFHNRSDLMLWTTSLSVILVPILIVLGRCDTKM